MPRLVALTLVAAIALVSPAAAQHSAPQPAVALRLPATGTLRQDESPNVRATADRLLLGRCDRGCLATVSMRDLARVDRYAVAQPSTKRRVAGVAVGVAAAAVAFTITGLTCWSANCSDATFYTAASVTMLAAGIGAYKLVTRHATSAAGDVSPGYEVGYGQTAARAGLSWR
jgi:hypothetical protein